jgi:hypothetical protein
MIVVGSGVIMRMNHAQMAGKFMDEVVNVSAEISVTSVEARSDLGGIDSVQNPQDVACVSKKQMRQFVLEYTHDAELFAMLGYPIQRFDHVLHPWQLLLGRNRRGILRARMQHKIVNAQKRRRFRRLANFRDRLGPLGGLRRSDVDIGREWRVKRVSLHPEVLDAVGSAVHQLEITKIEVLW